MKAKKIPAPKRAGTETMVREFLALLLELHELNPKRLEEFERELQRSHFPNKTY